VFLVLVIAGLLALLCGMGYLVVRSNLESARRKAESERELEERLRRDQERARDARRRHDELRRRLDNSSSGMVDKVDDAGKALLARNALKRKDEMFARERRRNRGSGDSTPPPPGF
jgi:hypothetical protein